MLMNKRSQFTRIFSQAILDMKETGRMDIFLVEKYRQRNQSCGIPDPKEKPLGYTKLAFLFAVLASGTFISLFVVLFEFFAKMYQIHKKPKSTTTIHERNSLDDNMKEILDNMSKDEIVETFQRILQEHVKSSYVDSHGEDNTSDFSRSIKYRVPTPSSSENE